MILTVQKNIEISLLQVDDKVVDVPVVVVAQVPQVHVVMKTAEIPQLQVKVVDVPVVLVVLVVPVPQVRVVKKTVEDSQRQIVEKIIEILEVLTVQGVLVSADLRALEQEEFDRKNKHQALERISECKVKQFIDAPQNLDETTAVVKLIPQDQVRKRQQHQKHNNEQQTTRQVTQEQWGEREGEEREKVRKGETGKKEKLRPRKGTKKQKR